jgi:rubrerythrin
MAMNSKDKERCSMETKKAAFRVISAYLKGAGSQLEMGKKVEEEHDDIYKYFEKFLKKHDLEMPLSRDEFFEMIAKSHIREIENYYDRLKKMEGEHHKEAAIEDTQYQIFDTQTKQSVGSPYKYSQRVRARGKAESMNQQHGAIRYIVQPIFSKEAMDFTSISSLITPEKKLTDSEIARALRLSIAAELDASHLYELIADAVSDKQVQEVLRDISNEEKVHEGELQELLSRFDKDHDKSVEEGRKEVKSTE